MDDDMAVDIIHKVSALTHAHLRSKMACGIYYFCVRHLADKKSPLREYLQEGIDEAFEYIELNKFFTSVLC